MHKVSLPDLQQNLRSGSPTVSMVPCDRVESLGGDRVSIETRCPLTAIACMVDLLDWMCMNTAHTPNVELLPLCKPKLVHVAKDEVANLC